MLATNSSPNMHENYINVDFQHQQETSYQPTRMQTDYQIAFDNQKPNQYAKIYIQSEKKINKAGVLSILFGIFSIFTSLVFLVSVPMGVIGLILGIKSKIKNAASKVGIALNITGLSLTVIVVIGVIILIALPSSSTYYGDGFSLEYDKNWSTTTLAGGQDALQYKNENSFLAPIGVSELSATTSNFDTSSGQAELYQSFYDYWNNDISTLNIYSGSDGFSELTDSIYYATYDYGVSATDIKGKYILLVSVENNAVLSFMSNAEENVEDNDSRALDLLKNIEIYEQTSETVENQIDNSDDNVIYDDGLYNALDSLSNWNRYSDLRSGDLGKSKSMNGGWRILSDSETYWKFEDGEFWWYESVNNLSDNYWYGTTQVLTGKAGLAVAGIDEGKLDTIISNSSGNVTADDVYTIVCTPTKIISGGVDKSETNIPAGTTWTYVWIIVDHGADGIEAQVLNTENYSTSYFVKITD